MYTHVLVTFASSSSHSPDKVQGKRYTGQEFEGKQSFPDSSVWACVGRSSQKRGRKRERIGRTVLENACSKLKRRNGSRKRKSSWNSRKGGRVWYECGTAGRLLHRGINTGRLQRPSLETKGKRERARMEGKCVCNDIGVQRGEKMVVVSRRKRDLVRVRYAPFDYRWSSSREPIENFVDL